MSRPLRIEELIVWKLACEFEDGVVDLVNRTRPALRDFKFAGQLTDAASSVPSNVSEGFHRFKAKEFAQFLRYARASLGEAEKRLRTGIRKNYFRSGDVEPLLQLARRLGKATMNFHAYLLRQADDKKQRDKLPPTSCGLPRLPHLPVLTRYLPALTCYDLSLMQTTFAIIKPDAVKAGHTGAILARIEQAGFRIAGMRLQHLSKKEAEGFYAVHRERPFFGELTTFMSSGPAVLLALQADDAIRKWRDLMGATDPAKADAGTLRKEFGTSIGNNATHGSDAAETAAFELGYFFRGMELV